MQANRFLVSVSCAAYKNYYTLYLPAFQLAKSQQLILEMIWQPATEKFCFLPWLKHLNYQALCTSAIRLRQGYKGS